MRYRLFTTRERDHLQRGREKERSFTTRERESYRSFTTRERSFTTRSCVNPKKLVFSPTLVCVFYKQTREKFTHVCERPPLIPTFLQVSVFLTWKSSPTQPRLRSGRAPSQFPLSPPPAGSPRSRSGPRAASFSPGRTSSKSGASWPRPWFPRASRQW